MNACPGRVPLEVVQAALLAEFERTRDRRWVQLTPGALRNLKYRGRISPGPGYDLRELTRYLDTRSSNDDAA